MVSHRTIGIRGLTLFGQMVAVTLCFWLWFFIWEDTAFDADAFFRRYLLYNEFLLVGILFGSHGKTEASASKNEWVVACRKSGRQAFFGFFSVFLIVFALKDSWISRSFFFSYLPWLYGSLLVTNLWLARSLALWTRAGRKERVALAGTLEQAVQLKPWLDHKQAVGMQTVGLIGLEPGAAPGSPFLLLGTLDQTGDILRRQAITHLIVLSLSLGGERLRHLTQVCEQSAVRLLVLHDLNTYFNHNTTVFDDDGLRFIGLREEPLENPLGRLAKRALDLAVALPVVCLILPVTTLAVWLLQRRYSPGPLLFAQQRNGMLGRPFRIYKYRTMHVCNDDEARQAAKNDSRIYPAGVWLRKLSIDELPQFLNVLLGDMSIVGPRPHMPAHDEMFTKIMRNYLIRRFIRPGITGWAQVSGFRGEIHCEKDVQDRVGADIYYLENWSFSLDLLIILKTIKACVLPPRSAY
jgi:putative colanic acid biosynthesis UDP-glucose lipid carrier transferase